MDTKIIRSFEEMGKQENKQKVWDEKMQDMLKPDIYGYVLDEGIRDVVVALNLLGVHTTQSDHGNYGDSPWVQFEAEKTLADVNVFFGEAELKAKIMQELGIRPEEINKKSPAFSRIKEVDIVDGARVQ